MTVGGTLAKSANLRARDAPGKLFEAPMRRQFLGSPSPQTSATTTVSLIMSTLEPVEEKAQESHISLPKAPASHAPTSSASASSSTAPLCAICALNAAKYTCPRCHMRTCSLPCSATHKTVGAGCSGVRNKAAYIPMNQYGYMALMDDYVYLEEIGRKVGDWGKEIVSGGYDASSSHSGHRGQMRSRGRGRGRGRGMARGGLAHANGPRSKRDVLKMELDHMDIEMDLLPVGMERRILNQSTWDHKCVKLSSVPQSALMSSANCLHSDSTALLTIEFIFHPPRFLLPSSQPAEPIRMLTHRNRISESLMSNLSTRLAERAGSKKKEKEKPLPEWLTDMLVPQAEDSTSFVMPICVMPTKLDPLASLTSSRTNPYVGLRPGHITRNAFYKLLYDEPLVTALKHKQFVEFPTIELWEEGAFLGTIVDDRGSIVRKYDGTDEDEDGPKPKRRKLNRKEGKKTLGGLLGGYGSESDEEGEDEKEEKNVLNLLSGYAGSDDESDDGESDGSEFEGEDAVERIKANAFDELTKLRGSEKGAPEEVGKTGKSVFEMKFMKDAATREKHRVDRMADDFVKEMGSTIAGEDSDEDSAEAPDQAQDTATQRTGGRVSYRPSNIAALRVVPSLASDTSSTTLKSTDLPPHQHPDSPSPISPIPEAQATAGPSNPWLSHEGVKAVQKKHEVAVSKDSAGAEKSKNKLRKRVKKREEEKEKAKEDAAVDVSMSNVMTLGNSSSVAGPSKVVAKGKQKRSLRSGAEPAGEDDEESDTNSELDEQEKTLDLKGKSKGKGIKAFQQRDLVARAFAGDDVVQDFEEAKRREIQEDAPKEVDTTLPGWGSWGGLGTKKAPSKPYLIKKIAGVDPTSRADFNKAHVIISEKRDKKAARYLVKDLPYPYTSKAQFERSMDAPIGSEWNTRVGFQRGTLPKVVRKMGTVITPLEKLT
ncbi:hypothetical protein NM688_g5978 [Phlebia brevispora]|uniref:Uncharacterized protein n=1 Tax=Phlebia brevispora TaxID=194682 RepID=A0ACC1SLS6_9APHY|nr:hypothetical protein NM688_g5978 [Phlebia brevispora]